MEDVLRLACVTGLGLHGAEPFTQLLHALVGRVDRCGRALEQLVHFVAAVTAEALTDLYVAKFAWCDLHSDQL